MTKLPATSSFGFCLIFKITIWGRCSGSVIVWGGTVLLLGTSCCLAPTGALSIRLQISVLLQKFFFYQICCIWMGCWLTCTEFISSLLAQCHPSSFQLDACRFLLGGSVVVWDFGACELVPPTFNSTDHCRPSVQLIPMRSEAIWPDSLCFSNAGNCIFVVDLFYPAQIYTWADYLSFQTLETVSLLLICFIFYDRYQLFLDIHVLNPVLFLYCLRDGVGGSIQDQCLTKICNFHFGS